MSFDFDLTYYLSGPMSGYKDFNYPAFDLACAILRERGIKIESPHENPWPKNHTEMVPEALWSHMMNLCIKQLDKCQGIIMLPGWPTSRGAREELMICLDRKYPVYFFDFDTLHSMNGRAENLEHVG